MPYIPKEERYKFSDSLDFVEMIESEGQLNYVLTTIIHKYLEQKKKNYCTLNSIMGVLSCVSLEFYRKIVSPYEDMKKQENGELSYTFKDFKEKTT